MDAREKLLEKQEKSAKKNEAKAEKSGGFKRISIEDDSDEEEEKT